MDGLTRWWCTENMPTWGWFVVALVVIDLAVVITWLLMRRSSPAVPIPVHTIDSLTRNEIVELIAERKKIHAIKLLRDRTSMPLRQAKDTVDAIEAEGQLL